MDYAVIGYAFDQGGAKPGAALGPKVLRERGLLRCFQNLGRSVIDYGDVSESSASAIPPKNLTPDEASMRNAETVYKACSALYKTTGDALQAGHFPIVIGGDHSGSLGSVAALSDHYQSKGKKVGLIYIDAHPDIHTWKTSTSKLIFGATVAVLTGQSPGEFENLQKRKPSVDLQSLAYLGIRDVDPAERAFINRTPICALSMREIDRHGFGNSVDKAIEIASRGTCGFFVSFDVDACDPNFASGTQFPIPGGLSYRESHLALEMLYASGKMLGFELSEFNPSFDNDHRTADFCLTLIESAIGKSIL